MPTQERTVTFAVSGEKPLRTHRVRGFEFVKARATDTMPLAASPAGAESPPRIEGGTYLSFGLGKVDNQPRGLIVDVTAAKRSGRHAAGRLVEGKTIPTVFYAERGVLYAPTSDAEIKVRRRRTGVEVDIADAKLQLVTIDPSSLGPPRGVAPDVAISLSMAAPVAVETKRWTQRQLERKMDKVGLRDLSGAPDAVPLGDPAWCAFCAWQIWHYTTTGHALLAQWYNPWAVFVLAPAAFATAAWWQGVFFASGCP